MSLWLLLASVVGKRRTLIPPSIVNENLKPMPEEVSLELE